MYLGYITRTEIMYIVFSHSKRKHKIASRKTLNFELYCNDS